MIFGIFSGGLAGATASQDLQVFTVASRRVLAPVYSKIGRRICAGLVIASCVLFGTDAAAAMADTRGPGAGLGAFVRPAVSSLDFGPTRDSDCTCEASFSGVGAVEVASCDLFTTNSCGGEYAIPGERGRHEFQGCECVCYTGEEVVAEIEPRDDSIGYFVRGVPEFWQFDFGCTFNGNPNAVGCGPIAMAEILYWYGSRGYPELVQNYLGENLLSTGSYEEVLDEINSNPDKQPEMVHLWQELVKDLRTNYIKRKGICGNGQYGTTEAGFLTIEDFAKDQGVSLRVDTHKINASRRDTGLAIVKQELKAGRPLVMRFNWKQARKTFFIDKGKPVFSGNLSIGTKYNDHYVVVTGYEKNADGRDIIHLNFGSGDKAGAAVKSKDESTGKKVLADFNGPEVAVEWNPADKWVRLYSIQLSSAEGDESNCEASVASDPFYFPPSFFDDGDGKPNSWSGDVETSFSHLSRTSTYTELGKWPVRLDDCGEVLDYLEVSDPTWETTGFSCSDRPEKGELQPQSSSIGPKSNLGPTLRGGIVVRNPADTFTGMPSQSMNKAELIEGMASDAN